MLRSLIVIPLAFLLATSCGNKANQSGDAAELLDHTEGSAKIDFDNLEGLTCKGENSQLEMDRAEGGTFTVTAAANNQKQYYQEVVKVRRIFGFKNWKRIQSHTKGTLAYINQADLRAFTRIDNRFVKQTCEVKKKDEPVEQNQTILCESEEGGQKFKIGIDYKNEVASFNGVDEETNSSYLIDDKAKVTLRRSGLEGLVIGMSIQARSTPDFSGDRCWDWVRNYHLDFNGVGLPQDGDLTLSQYPKANRPDCAVPRIHLQPLRTKISCEDAEVKPPRICTQDAGMLYNPDTNKCQGYTNGCQRADMIAAGFTTPPPGSCGIR